MACLRLGQPGPAILLSGHLGGATAILVYRVPDYAAMLAQLREQDVPVRELEIPHGPCATFTMEAGQRYAVYQLTRPDAVHYFDGRIDPYRRTWCCSPVTGRCLTTHVECPGRELCQCHDAAVPLS